MHIAIHLSAWSAAPLLGIFLARLILPKLVKFSYSWHMIIFSYMFTLTLMSLTRGVFGASEQVTIMIGVIGTTIFLCPYSWIMKKEKDLYEVHS
jgi:hypothetical protein